ncbi:hypothetical protein AERO8C_20128 [Aeromonas veronii]|uniref:Uncharacterized protein n=1 Tax=Aeromonas veronii TaxID=654 RepID=A0A653L2E7_AERVE|nr:hypothetical protein AERO8C_20128 [Aeromonas veronii]
MRKGQPFEAEFVTSICYTSRPPFSGSLSDLMSGAAVGGYNLRLAHAELTKPNTAQLEHRNPL